MSLLITCEVGGDAIPHWLGPHLHQLAENTLRPTKRKRRAKSRTRKNSPKRSSHHQAKSKHSNLPVDEASDQQPKHASSPSFAFTAPSLQTISFTDPALSGTQRSIGQTALQAPKGQHQVSDLIDGFANSSALSTLMRRLRVDRHGIEIASRLATNLKAERRFHRYPIELVDVTKDRKQRRLFSGPFQKLERSIQHQLLEKVHEPYLDHLSDCIESQIKEDGFVIHFSVRSFPLKKQGTIRRTDVGLLYDPSNQDEVDLCMDLVDDMWYRAPMLKVRRNYPRRGTEVGVTRRLRRRFSGSDYLGVELWLNRAWAGRAVSLRDEALRAMTESIASVAGIADSPLEESTSLYDAA